MLLRKNFVKPLLYILFPFQFIVANLVKVSAIQIIIVAVSVVFTLGLITCVLSHYKMGARSWSERRHKASHKTTSQDFHLFHIAHCPQNLTRHCLASISHSQMPKIVFAPVEIEDRRQPKAKIRHKSVQADVTLDLPSTVSMPDGEEYPCGNAKGLRIRDREQESEIYRSYIKPPPNRTVFELDVLATRSCLDASCCRHASRGIKRTSADNPLTSHLKSPSFNSFSSSRLSCHVSSSQTPSLCLVSVSSDTDENLLDQTDMSQHSDTTASVSFGRPVATKTRSSI